MVAYYDIDTQDRGDGTTTLVVTWRETDTDEGIVSGKTHVKGGESEARRYARVFAADLRRNNTELFPESPAPTEEDEDE